MVAGDFWPNEHQVANNTKKILNLRISLIDIEKILTYILVMILDEL